MHETIKAARKLLGEEEVIWVHTHETAGVGITQYQAAIEAGCDGVDIARSPLSGGTCQPDLLSLWHTLKGSDFTLDIDVAKIMEANQVLEECLKDYFFLPEARQVSSEVILSPMPGGALTANTMTMRDTGTLHLYPKVIEAMTYFGHMIANPKTALPGTAAQFGIFTTLIGALVLSELVPGIDFDLLFAMGPNVSGVIGSAVAAEVLLTLKNLLV